MKLKPGSLPCVSCVAKIMYTLATKLVRWDNSTGLNSTLMVYPLTILELKSMSIPSLQWTNGTLLGIDMRSG